jgi:acyl-CoA synthetase (AMP-forming)/AMP-acid ligase II
MHVGRQDNYSLSIATMLRQASARILLVDRRIKPAFDTVTSLYPPPLGLFSLDQLPNGMSPDISVSPLDLALVQFSSGTTRSPKPIALSHRALIAQISSLNGFWPDSDDIHHTGVSWLPLYHDMGLIGCVFSALARPSTLTLIGPGSFVARPSVWLRAISSFGATISPASNFALALAVSRVRDEEMDGVDLSCWRAAPIGGETIAPSTLRAFQKRFSRWGLKDTTLTPVYGLSEAALAVTFSDLDQPFRTAAFNREALWARDEAVPNPSGLELVSLGRTIPGTQLRIRDDHGRDLPPRRIGRVWVRTPSLMDGYLDQPELTAEVMEGEWLDTGDLGFLDAEELFLVARAKDLIVVRGRKYDPGVLEAAVGDISGVREGRAVAVCRLDETGDGEKLMLFVEGRRNNSAEDRRRLQDRCRAAVLDATGVAPDQVVVVDPGTLPRTSSGKLRRSESLRRFELGAIEAQDRCGDTSLRVMPP